MSEMPDAVAMVELLQNGALTPAEAVGAAVKRAGQVNPRLNAIIETDYDAALEAADGKSVAPGEALSGLPFLLKDYLQVAGGRAYQGNRLLKEKDLRFGWSSWVAEKLKGSGMISLGVTHAPEFGCGDCACTSESQLYGPTRNPWNPDHTAMGSSGGAAAAVAAGIVPLAHGSDGGGSIRMPASACGLVGLKPGRGRLSQSPGAEGWGGGSTSGVLSRTVRDTALGLDVLSGPGPGDPLTAVYTPSSWSALLDKPVGPLRIGMATDFSYTKADKECRRAVTNAGTLLRELGHQVDEGYPVALDEVQFGPEYMTVVNACIAQELAAWEPQLERAWTEEDVEAGTWDALVSGRDVSASGFLTSQDWLRRWSGRVCSWWEQDGFDILMTPTLGLLPPKVGWLTAGDKMQRFGRQFAVMPFTMQFNITGQPAISLPLHQSKKGLPVGVQLVAAMGREDILLQLARQLEEACNWHERRPQIFASDP